MGKTKKVTIFIDTEGFWEDSVMKSFNNGQVVLDIKKALLACDKFKDHHL